MHNILSAILRGVWAIEPSIARSYFPQITLLLQGKALPQKDNDNRIKMAVISPDNSYSWVDSLSKVDAESLALIPISGPIMKHDYCGDAGTATRGEQIKQASKNPNISAIILQIDSPGGTVDGTQSLADIIKQVEKPVITFVDGMMASAALWIGSSANEIIASTPNDIVGSIGTMMSFADYSKHYSDQGITLHEVYADKSTHKNGMFKQALNGDYSSLKEELLNPLNESFISAVKANRAGKFDARKENIFSGKTYLAKDAITHGLVDSIGTIDDAIARAKQLAKQQSKINAKNSDMKIKSAWKGIIASIKKGFNVEATDETVMTVEYAEHLNAELEAKEIELTAKAKELADVQSTLDALKAEKQNIEKENETLFAEKVTLTEKVEQLSKTPAVITPAAAKEKDVDGEKKSFINPNAEHNKLADKVSGK